MNSILQYDNEHIAKIFESVKKLSVDYLNELNDRPVSIINPSFNLPNLPAKGFGAALTQSLFEKEFLPNILATSGKRYWGFVTGGSTPASIAGDWLTSVFDQNTQSTKGNGDVSAALELHTIKLLLDLFNLPEKFTGAFVSGATMSNFTALAVARQWYGKQSGKDFARDGISDKIKIYSAVPHSSSIKCLSMLGIGSNNITIIPTLHDRECIDMDVLESIINKNIAEPFILISNGGTVNTVDYDDMQRINKLKEKYNFWWHVDAAFGGFAACSHQYQHLINGWRNADSITVDFHKWLNVPYDSAVVFTKNEHAVLQVQTFQNSNAPYIGDPMDNFNFLNYVPENSRRFRALATWFSLMAYGKEGYKDIVENNINLANQLGKFINQSSYYKLAAPVRLNTVCFTISDEQNRNEKIPTILKELNKRGKVFMTPTLYKGISCIRAALVNWRTAEEDIEIAINELKEISAIIK
jgi:glutamate/tyrosine decarboxylase-like PLP-dependent enzyme